MSEQAVLLDIFSHVAHITLNRPEKGNVVNDGNLNLITEYFKEIENNEDIRAVVIQGKDGIFSRGLDFSSFLNIADNNTNNILTEDFSKPYLEAVTSIYFSKKPVIAAVDGEVLAGGMGIMLASDIILVSERSIFGLSETLFGLIPAYVFPFLLDRVSYKKARYLILSSKRFTAKEALMIGIADEVVPADKLKKSIKQHLKRLLAASPHALEMVKSYSDSIKKQEIRLALKTAATQLTTLLNDKKNVKAIKDFISGDMMPWLVHYRKKRT